MDIYDFLDDAHEDIRRAVWGYVLKNVMIGELVANRESTGETERDFIKWRAEVTNESVKNCLMVMEFFE